MRVCTQSGKDTADVCTLQSICNLYAEKTKADEAAVDADLEERMAIAQKITSMVLALRRKVNIKVRQPLQQIMIPAVDDVPTRCSAVRQFVLVLWEWAGSCTGAGLFGFAA